MPILCNKPVMKAKTYIHKNKVTKSAYRIIEAMPYTSKYAYIMSLTQNLPQKIKDTFDTDKRFSS